MTDVDVDRSGVDGAVYSVCGIEAVFRPPTAIDVSLTGRGENGLCCDDTVPGYMVHGVTSGYCRYCLFSGGFLSM